MKNYLNAKQINIVFLLCLLVVSGFDIYGQQINRNKPEREKWFSEQGLGMFIHLSVDVQLGGNIAHNVFASSKDYQKYYFEELPKTFNPKKFDPEEWAILAKLARMKYVVICTKHINGFCLWNTQSSDFNVMNTPFARDFLKETIAAFRKYGIAVGLYFSPNDAHVMYKQGYSLSRRSPESNISNNKELWRVTQQQLRELFSNYGKIDILFIDDPDTKNTQPVADYCWEMDPDLVITRGAMLTPELRSEGNNPLELPTAIVHKAWEACATTTAEWSYVQGTPDKSIYEILQVYFETRAKGGNLLLNVHPMSNGELPEGNIGLLRRLAIWQASNHEAVDKVVPCARPLVDGIWYTKAKDQDSVYYAFLDATDWVWRTRKAFLLSPIQGNSFTKVSVLGQDETKMQYNMDVSPSTYFALHTEGLFVSVMKSHRSYYDIKEIDRSAPPWIVIKMEKADFKTHETKIIVPDL